MWDDGNVKWYFTIYADNPSDPKTSRYGLVDEAGKININTADEAALLRLPNMTPEPGRLPAGLPRPGQRNPPGRGRAGLLRPASPSRTSPQRAVRHAGGAADGQGLQRRIVYGEDANLNGLLDQNEDDGDQSFPPDNSDGQLDTGCGPSRPP